MTDQPSTDELDDNSAPHAQEPEFRTASAASSSAAATSMTVPQPVPSPESVPPVGRRRRRQRVSKWDRPPDPHDWRFFVGNFGKVLIATGMLMFGFVAYQLWGTGIETARAQSALKNEFLELVSENQSSRPSPDAGVSADQGAPVATSTPGTTVTPDEQTADDADGAGTEAPNAGGAGGDDSVTATVPLVPVEQDIPPIFRGDPLALLEIPAIGRSDIVVPGVSLNDLKDGPGHYPDTPLPGQLGNAAIAGHRTTYGAPFFNVDDLVAGDELIVTMLTGDQFTYEVTYIEIVSASDYWVVSTSNPNVAELTLTSCHPKYTARERIVVHSVLNPAKSANVGFPTAPYQLEPEADPDPAPGDDPVLVAEQSGAGAIDPSGNADPQPASDETPATSTSTVGVQPDLSADQSAVVDADPATNDVPITTAVDTDDPDVGDAFSQGWFDDRSAFPQIALWGMALTLISLAAYAISRRFRHDSIGFLVGIAPFLFALYFFFQNVNRLLPPGL